jgi:hypothetical protein
VAISNGQQTLRKASKYLGAMEGAPNRSGDPIINECQAPWGWPNGGQPWCAMFVAYCVAESGATPKYKQAAKTIMSPSTAVMVDKAQRKGWYGGHSRNTKPGDLFIIDGKHVGFINQVRNDGTFATIEGNASDGCRSLIRSWRDGWKVISIPGVGAPGPAAVVDGYGFDDTRVKLYGGWPTPEARNQQMRKFAAANPEFWTQAIRVARSSPFAFRAGPAGTYNRWTYGPWLHGTGKQTRDKQMEQWSKKHEGVTARPWKKTYKES